MASFIRTMPFLILTSLFFSVFTHPHFAHSNFIQSEHLTVPSTAFLTSIKSTIQEIQKVSSLVSKFTSSFHDHRFSIAINDCVELLNFSSDELNWTQDATQNPNGRGKSAGDRSSDLRTWLSAALGNQDTCIEGFEGTNSIVKKLISGSLQQVSSLVREILVMASKDFAGKSPPAGPGTGRKLKSYDFPAWVGPGDRRLLQAPTSGSTADVIVAGDGTGKFTKVMDAVLAAPDYSSCRYVIYVKRGVYKENVEINKKKWNLMMIGDGMGVTVISGNRSFVDGWTTFRSATFAVAGRGFIARDMTFENTAGPQKHQAVALRSDSDLSTYFRCGFNGYQDTLYAHSLRQFYRECQISGTVDFIFGNGAVVFQNCQILARKPLLNQKNTITAQGRKDPYQNTGFSIQFSNITSDSSMDPTPTYLGRPWKAYSRTVFMQSYMDSVISPEGWLEWQGDFGLKTLYYGEYLNYGPGAGLGSRVKWAGYHVINTTNEAGKFTVAQFIDGNSWLPATGVRYKGGWAV